MKNSEENYYLDFGSEWVHQIFLTVRITEVTKDGNIEIPWKKVVTWEIFFQNEESYIWNVNNIIIRWFSQTQAIGWENNVKAEKLIWFMNQSLVLIDRAAKIWDWKLQEKIFYRLTYKFWALNLSINYQPVRKG